MQHIYQTLANRIPQVLGQQALSNYAVLVPLVEINGEMCILFEERAHHLKSQPGEICFPGGRIDPDDRDELAAALRETHEELSVPIPIIEPVGPLDYIVSNYFIVHPFVGRITDPAAIHPQADEVHSVFYVPLEFLLSSTPAIHYVDLQVVPQEDFPYDHIPKGRDYNWRAAQLPQYFYYYEDRIIWGLTARILHHFLELIK